MNLTLRCPSCDSSNQFVQAADLNAESSDDYPVHCTCGTVTPLGVLKANGLQSQAARHELERLAGEAARRALGKLLK